MTSSNIIICFSTYFVEYQFPVVATSRDKYQPHAMATEVSRVASKKISDRGISLLFQVDVSLTAEIGFFVKKEKGTMNMKVIVILIMFRPLSSRHIRTSFSLSCDVRWGVHRKVVEISSGV